jgi:hypothetical protein
MARTAPTSTAVISRALPRPQTVRSGLPSIKEVRGQLELWARLYLSQSEKYPEIAGIGFAKVSEVLPLQGADLIATETYQFAQAWLKNPSNPE